MEFSFGGYSSGNMETEVPEESRDEARVGIWGKKKLKQFADIVYRF